jgi:aspartate kinase
MLVYKFGGASVKDAEAIFNVAKIIKAANEKPLAVVISAMGKTTNALEEIWRAYRNKEVALAEQLTDKLADKHIEIWHTLVKNSKDGTKYQPKFLRFFEQLKDKLKNPLAEDADFDYDQIICFGELVATSLISDFLNGAGVTNTWLDAGNLIRTNNRYREGKIDWERSQHLADELKKVFYDENPKGVLITQGFIGKTPENFYCSLGREGSDFSAAILAWLFNAENVTIWKDVPGMLNADPKYFSNTVKLNKISYREAIELAYYGASVIHPKTIKPLQNKEINLYIKSFFNPHEKGSVICSDSEASPNVPCYIFKDNQVLISISPLDFSFMVENNLRDIFDVFHKKGVRVNLMQNSAVSFSVAIDENEKLDSLVKTLQENYRVLYNKNCQLLTVRHYNEAILENLTQQKEILVEQKNRQTVRFVMR